MIQRRNDLHKQAVILLNGENKTDKILPLHVAGSNLALKIWETVLKIPFSNTISYATLTKAIDEPCTVKIVSNTLMNNPIACIIPCHRVIQATGELGQYHWGAQKKAAIIGWEASQKALLPANENKH